MAKAPRLKVFQAQFGFYDSVVAASSRAAALRAWGTHQNLFADGQAHVTTDEAAVKAALAHPETPLRRAVGSNDGFELNPTSLRKIPDAPKRAENATSPAKSETKALPKPPADRSKLDATEATLRTLDEDRKREEANLRLRRDELDAEIAAAQDAYVRHRRAATAAVVEARKAYRKLAARTDLPCLARLGFRRGGLRGRLGGRFRCALVFAGKARAESGHQIHDVGVIGIGDLGRRVPLLLVLD